MIFENVDDNKNLTISLLTLGLELYANLRIVKMFGQKCLPNYCNVMSALSRGGILNQKLIKMSFQFRSSILKAGSTILTVFSFCPLPVACSRTSRHLSYVHKDNKLTGTGCN